MARKKITALEGRRVETVRSSGSYIIIRFERGAELQIAADHAFDKEGDRYENDAPLLQAPRAKR